jgi:hypothetical protein
MALFDKLTAANQQRRIGAAPSSSQFSLGVSNPFEFGGSFSPDSQKRLVELDPDSHRDRRDIPFGSMFRAGYPIPYSASSRSVNSKTALEARAAMASAYPRQKRKGRSKKFYCFTAIFILLGMWVALMLRQLFSASYVLHARDIGSIAVASPLLPVLQADADMFPDDAPALTPMHILPEPGVPVISSALSPDPAMPASTVDEAYALQRLQAAAEDAAEGWDTGGIGGDAALASMRAALLRDHEAALARDAVTHRETGKDGGGATDHSTAHHHDG